MSNMSMKKIFLIDDDEGIRDALTSCLAYEGYTVVACVNGQEALSSLKQNITELPSLIILDLMMPVMDGYEFREAQLADNRLCQIPVIVTSAGNKDEITNINIFKGIYYMRKPIDLDDLFKIIEKHLD